jgi:hypothetical protein
MEGKYETRTLKLKLFWRVILLLAVTWCLNQLHTHTIQFIKQDPMTATALINKPEYKLQISGNQLLMNNY